MTEKIAALWRNLYGEDHADEFDRLTAVLEAARATLDAEPADSDPYWYKHAVIYALYVDAFAEHFDGVSENLDHLQKLGVNTLWLLPILKSPLRDQGFDISDYRDVREDLGGLEGFRRFMKCARDHNIRVIFDLAVNHTSDQHPWFVNARQSRDSQYRDYYIWSDTEEKYSQARLLFKGMVPSNWERNEATGDYYFHRFYEFQPDLNYRNPAVLIEMLSTFLFWMEEGVDGLRMDAIPFLWKEDGTNCENLPQTHLILKLFRAALDYCRPGMFLVAEANMEPKDVVQYFGDGDECHAAYHFPVMPQFFLAIAEGDYRPIENALSHEVTPPTPEGTEWLLFLRCHDELTLEFADASVRTRMIDHYLLGPKYDFREGEGIAGRLFNLMRGDTRKIECIYSMLFAAGGAPVIYYGDEIGMENSEEFYEMYRKQTGFDDARFLNRGALDWSKPEIAHADHEATEGEIFHALRRFVHWRVQFKALFEGKRSVRDLGDASLYCVEWREGDEKLIILHNLSSAARTTQIGDDVADLHADEAISDEVWLDAYGVKWMKTRSG